MAVGPEGNNRIWVFVLALLALFVFGSGAYFSGLVPDLQRAVGLGEVPPGTQQDAEAGEPDTGVEAAESGTPEAPAGADPETSETIAAAAPDEGTQEPDVLPLEVPGFDVVRVEPDGTTLIAGTAAPGANVTFFLDQGEIGEVTAGSDGKFAHFLTLEQSTEVRVLSMISALGTQTAEAEDQIILAPTPPVEIAQADIVPGTEPEPDTTALTEDTDEVAQAQATPDEETVTEPRETPPAEVSDEQPDQIAAAAVPVTENAEADSQAGSAAVQDSPEPEAAETVVAEATVPEDTGETEQVAEAETVEQEDAGADTAVAQAEVTVDVAETGGADAENQDSAATEDAEVAEAEDDPATTPDDETALADLEGAQDGQDTLALADLSARSGQVAIGEPDASDSGTDDAEAPKPNLEDTAAVPEATATETAQSDTGTDSAETDEAVVGTSAEPASETPAPQAQNATETALAEAADVGQTEGEATLETASDDPLISVEGEAVTAETEAEPQVIATDSQEVETAAVAPETEAVSTPEANDASDETETTAGSETVAESQQSDATGADEVAQAVNEAAEDGTEATAGNAGEDAFAVSEADENTEPAPVEAPEPPRGVRVSALTSEPAAAPTPEIPDETATATSGSSDPAPASGIASVAVLRAGRDGVELLQPLTPERPEAMAQIALDTISYSEAGEVQLAGRAKGQSVVRVYLNNRPVADLDTDEAGKWKGQLEGIDPGIYTLRLDEIDAEGEVVSRLETPFKREAPEVLNPPQRDDAPEPTPLIRAVTVQKGDTLWAISRDRYGDGILYVRVFDANRQHIRNPDLIYPGQVFKIPD